MINSILQRLQARVGPGNAPRQLMTWDNVQLASSSVAGAVATPVQAANIAVDANNDETLIVLTTNAIHTILAPTNATPGRRITVTIRNTSGGAAGAATWTGGAGGYRLAGAWVQAGNNNQRSASFIFDGTNWLEYARNAADVPV